jgi:phenylacetate-CoA ligase
MISSVIPGLTWPAIPNPQHAALLALQFQLEQSQWRSPEQIADHQMQQANLLLAHAARTVPYYQGYLPDIFAANGGKLDWASWHQIPVLERTDIQTHNEALVSQAIPQSHLPVSAGRTSGSTGRPIELLKTSVTGLLWCAFTLRGHLWHKRDLTAKLATIKAFGQPLPEEGLEMDTWGPSTEMYANRGRAAVLSVHTATTRQLAWLQAQMPDYLLSYPSNLAALAEESLKQSIKLPALQEVISMGEKLTEQQRVLCREAWGVEIKDIYSAEEIGYIAHQSPLDESYLVQAEHVILEVLDEGGRPCEAGEVGRVVVTTLNNFAKPLIRYAIGDYAEVGERSVCGRGLPVLKRIMGRTRNMFIKPGGEVFWPNMPIVAPEFVARMPRVRQYQYVQKAMDWIEIRIGAEAAYAEEIERAFVHAVHRDFGYPYRVTFSYMKEIPRGGSQKYEEFVSEL